MHDFATRSDAQNGGLCRRVEWDTGCRARKGAPETGARYRRIQGNSASVPRWLWACEGRSGRDRSPHSVAEKEAANVMRNKAQQFEQPKRRGVDVPWDGPARFRRKQPKPAKPQPQLALS